MKAIRKSDGKIIDVEVHGWSGDRAISYHTNFKDFYKPEDLDFNVVETRVGTIGKPFDWQSFRAEAAKDIMCAVLPEIKIIDCDFQQSIENAISDSVDVVDELIKQLKKEKK